MFLRCFLSEMDNFNVAPMLFQVLGDKPSMAAVRFILAAKQASVFDDLFRNGFFDPPLTHKRAKAYFIGLPIATSIPVVVQQLLRRRQFGHVYVIHLAEFAQEIREVVLLRETGELRPIVEPHVDDTPGAGLAKQIEKTLGGLSRESDGGDFHVSVGCSWQIIQSGVFSTKIRNHWTTLQQRG